MKTIAPVLPLFLLLFLLTTCHLERLDLPVDNCTGVTPTVAFLADPAVSGVNSPVTITNQTEGASTYVWDFGDGSIDVSKDPQPHIYTAAGTYRIKLVARSAGACVDSAFQTVTVSVLKYKRKLDAGSLNAFPLGLTQRPNGKYHVLYNNQSNEIRLAGYDPLGAVDGTAALIPITITPGGATPNATGGFMLGGNKSTLAKMGVITDEATLTAQPEFQFTGASSSAIYGVTLATQVLASGVGIKASLVYPGLALLSTVGVLNSPFLVEHAQTRGYYGVAAAQRPDGSYLMAANCWSGACSPACKVVAVSIGGGYLGEFSISTLTQVAKMIRLSGDNYALIGYSADGAPKIVGLNAATNTTWTISLPITEVTDIIQTSDNNIAVCGTLQQKIYLAKYPASNGASALFSKTVQETGSELYGYSLIQTSDGGFAVLAQIVESGAYGLYLLKTDSAGNY